MFYPCRQYALQLPSNMGYWNGWLVPLRLLSSFFCYNHPRHRQPSSTTQSGFRPNNYTMRDHFDPHVTQVNLKATRQQLDPEVLNLTLGLNVVVVQSASLKSFIGPRHGVHISLVVVSLHYKAPSVCCVRFTWFLSSTWLAELLVCQS